MTVASAACLGQARATVALRPRRGGGCRAWERTARRVVTADARSGEHADTASDATRVVRLDDGPGGSTLHLVGVSHVLVDDAARDIRALMRRLRPDAVVLELCAERAPGAMAAALAGVSADTASPPAVIPRAVRIEGLPSKPLPGASEAELLSLLRARAGAVVTPRDLASDRDALMALGHFREVDVDVLVEDADAAAAAPALVGARLDSTADAGPDPADDSRGPLTEVIAVRSVELRVAPDAAAAVTADIRFSWGRRARRAFGDRAEVERKIVRGALEMLLEEQEEEQAEEDEEDEEAHDVACLWEGVALRSGSRRLSSRGVSRRLSRRRSRFERERGRRRRGRRAVGARRGGRRTRVPRFRRARRSEPRERAARRPGGRPKNEKRRGVARGKKGFRDNSRRARGGGCAFGFLDAFRVPRRARVPGSLRAGAGARGGRDWTRKAPAGAETAAALAAAMAAGARAVVLGDVPASETLAGVVDGLKDASREKRRELHARLGSRRDARVRLRLRVRQSGASERCRRRAAGIRRRGKGKRTRTRTRRARRAGRSDRRVSDSPRRASIRRSVVCRGAERRRSRFGPGVRARRERGGAAGAVRDVRVREVVGPFSPSRAGRG